jgi:hypothetical protein
MEKRVLDNKLQSFFRNVIRQSFRQLGIYDSTVTSYVADVLTDFARSENLYRMRSRKGKRMESVVEILSEQPPPPIDDETQLLKERSLRKYLGDYALFMSGIFRNHVEGRGFRYYIQEGSRPYWICLSSTLLTNWVHPQELAKLEYFWRPGLYSPILPPPVIPLLDSCVKSRAG